MLCHVAAKIFKCLKVIKYGLNLLEKIRFRPVKMLSRSSIQNKDKSPNSPNNRGKSTGQIGIFIAILIPLIGFHGIRQTLPSFSKTRDKFR